MIDAVVSVHRDPTRCGVTKFNLELAKRLGVRHAFLSLSGDRREGMLAPLFSFRASEWTTWGRDFGPYERMGVWPIAGYRLFFHDVPPEWNQREKETLYGAAEIWAANPDIHRAIAAVEPRVQLAHCPSVIASSAYPAGIQILAFGMVGKNHPRSDTAWQMLATVLANTPETYTLNFSVALHEGQTWEDVTAAVTRMREHFGERLRYVGHLSDEALDFEIRAAQAVAAFYDPAVRQNNTSAWAVLERGTVLVTNLDADSPLTHDVNCFNIYRLTEWPTPDRRRAVRAGGVAIAQQYGWDALVAQLQPAHTSV